MSNSASNSKSDLVEELIEDLLLTVDNETVIKLKNGNKVLQRFLTISING